MVTYSVMSNGFYDVREKQYSRSRIGKQLASATQYMWKPLPRIRKRNTPRFTDCEWSNEKLRLLGHGICRFR